MIDSVLLAASVAASGIIGAGATFVIMGDRHFKRSNEALNSPLDDESDWLADCNDRRADLIAVLQGKLDAIADATRNVTNGTGVKIYRMTGRG